LGFESRSVYLLILGLVAFRPTTVHQKKNIAQEIEIFVLWTVGQS